MKGVRETGWGNHSFTPSFMGSRADRLWRGWGRGPAARARTGASYLLLLVAGMAGGGDQETASGPPSPAPPPPLGRSPCGPPPPAAAAIPAAPLPWVCHSGPLLDCSPPSLSACFCISDASVHCLFPSLYLSPSLPSQSLSLSLTHSHRKRQSPQGVPTSCCIYPTSLQSLLCAPHSLSPHHTWSPILPHPPPQ